MNTITYKELQPVMPSWILNSVVALNIAIFAVFAYIFYAQTVLGQEVGNQPMSSGFALALCVLVAFLIYFLWHLKIKIRVTETNLHLSMGSFIGKKTILLADIENVADYQSNPAKDFFGYGYRFGLKQTGYVGRANQAVILTIKNQSRPLVITTADADSFKLSLSTN